MLSDTIAAIATPKGNAGIGVVRCSGSDAFFIAGSLFSRSLEGREGNTLLHGTLRRRDGRPIDEVVLSLFRAPASYTGEDTVEISAHGSMLILEEILEALAEAGARQAEPGEFTKRAFLNGKLDLSQAEAVNDVIKARTLSAKNMALRQLQGGLREQIGAMERSLLALVARIEAAIDFPEDVPDPDVDYMQAAAENLCARAESLLRASERTRFFRDGARIAIAGSVNAGKSSLLNALLSRNRAIVTPIAGTTRDTLEETVDVMGIGCSFIDTAGVRPTSDPVEKEGVERSLEAIETSDAAIMLFDGARPLSEDDREVFAATSKAVCIPVINKKDAAREAFTREICGFLSEAGHTPPLMINAKNREGIDLLLKSIYNIFISDDFSQDAVIMTSLRHRERLKDAYRSLESALESIKGSMPPDLISIDLRGALLSLGQITGSGASEDLLDTIFSEFCIGK